MGEPDHFHLSKNNKHTGKTQAMVVKTELCTFSGYRIYPGHGKRFIRGDSKPFWFLNARCRGNFLLKKNPRKLPWTQVYRRLHKKGTLEEVTKKSRRRVVKVQRPIEGADLNYIKAKRNQKPEVRQAAREAALREIKEQKRKKQQEKKAQKTAAAAAQSAKAAKGAKGPKGSKKTANPKAGAKAKK